MHNKVGSCSFVSFFLMLVLSVLHVSSLWAMEGFSSSFEEIEGEVQSKYPAFFFDNDKLDREAIEVYRKSWVGFTGKTREVFVTLHNPALLPVLEKLEQDIGSWASMLAPTHGAVIGRFIREIQLYKAMESVSPRWLERFSFRFLCATSTFTPEEENFIDHFIDPYPRVFFALKQNEAWRNHESAVESMDKYDPRALGLPYNHSVLPYEIVQEIRDSVEKILPIQITYSLWGRGKVGVATVVKAMLDDIFLIGIPANNLSAHGIPLSPYGFAVHDLFHMSIDHRRSQFIQHIIDEGEKYVRSGGSLRTFLSIFLPSALAKYQGIMGGLREIYQKIIGTFDDLDSRMALLGFFWILHEEPHFPPFLYAVRNFDDILTIITEDGEEFDTSDEPLSIVEALEKERVTTGIDLKDRFETSPIDGSTRWTDEEIIEWVLKNKKIREARKYELIGYLGNDDESIKGEDIIEQSVKRSPRYIDVIFTLRCEEKITYAFQTLFYTVQATYDALSMLKLVGIKNELPDILSTPDPRQTVKDWVKQSEKQIDSLIRHFRKVASRFANEDIPGKRSLVVRYAQLYDKSNLPLFS